MNDIDLLGALEDVSVELSNRVSDFPGPTCTEISRVISSIRPVAKETDRLQRMKLDDGEINSFVNEADYLLYSLEDDLEGLRAANDALRTALHEALESRKSAAAEINKLIDLLTAKAGRPDDPVAAGIAPSTEAPDD
jgi:hypothetical protein